jgi:tetratricopeptide (TPR) repeat protein
VVDDSLQTGASRAEAIKSGALQLASKPNYQKVIVLYPSLQRQAPQMPGAGERKNRIAFFMSNLTKRLSTWLSWRDARRQSDRRAASDGPARALARASGLTTQPRHASALRVAALVVALLLAGSAYLAYRDQMRTALRAGREGLNLVAPDEKARQYVLLGERSRQQGDYEAAIENFKRALELTPNYTTAHLQLAESYKAIGRVEDALGSYSRLLEIDPKNLEARLQRAELYRERGAWRQALQDYDYIIASDPQSEQAVVALDALDTFTAERAANYGALRLRRQAARPNGPMLPVEGDRSHIHLPLSELALTVLSRQPVLGNNPSGEDPAGARELAEYHKRIGNGFSNVRQYQEAIKEYKTALNLTPDDKDLHYLIATAYKASGQLDLALEHYRKCDSGTYAQVAQGAVPGMEKAARNQAKKEAKKKAQKRDSD